MRFYQIKKILYWDFNATQEEHAKIFRVLRQAQANSRSGKATPLTIKHSGLLLHEMRLLKENFELRLIRKAVKISGVGHTRLMRYARSRILEKRSYL